MKVLVLAGGLSSERNVSLSSGAKIAQALRELGHDVALMDLFFGLEDYPGLDAAGLFGAPIPERWRTVDPQAPDLDEVRARRKDKSRSVFGPGVLEAAGLADVVFLGLHGQCGEDGRIQAAFDLLGIPYTGSGYLGSGIAMDKDFTKRLARSEGIPTPQWQYVTVDEKNLETLASETPVPVVVKVPRGGSSIGVRVCKTRQDLREALEAGMGQKLILEEYVEGREFSCGVLDGVALPPIEIIPKEGFYDYKNKYQAGATLEVCPAQIDGATAAAMGSYARRVHKLLGLSAYSRSDFLMDRDGRIYFLEVNTLPGMTPTSLLPQEAGAVGVDYPALCQKIIDVAIRERG